MSQSVIGNFGRLWGRGHEVFSQELRRIISVNGVGATQYLQNLVTCDLQSPPTPPRPERLDAARPGVPKYLKVPKEEDVHMVEFSDLLRAACFLDPKGRILTDSLVWKLSDQQYFLDVPGSAADELLDHLKQYKLRRSQVEIMDRTGHMASAVIYGTLNVPGAPPGYMAGLDPRHPSLGMRVLKLPDGEVPSYTLKEFSDLLTRNTFPELHGNYELIRRLAGVAEGAEITGKVALEANQEHLNAVSFSKGCYLGQELTARVHHTGVLRKRIMPVFVYATNQELPSAWTVASNLQQGRSLKRFTKEELGIMPSRLPRLSVMTAGGLTGASTGSFEFGESIKLDDKAADELQMLQNRSKEHVESLQRNCVSGAKIKDKDKTVGQIISPPIPGTNVVLAMMRLEDVGLLSGGIWQNTNKVQIEEGTYRYLPYLPLWWPELDPNTGKAPSSPESRETMYDNEVYVPDERFKDDGIPPGSIGITIERESINPSESEQGNADNK